MVQIDIRDYPGAIDAINAVVSNGNVAEIKVEVKHGKQEYAQLTIVEQCRRVKNIDDVRKAGSDK